MYMEGLISILEYNAWLVNLGVDPAVVMYLSDTLTLRRFLERL